MKTIKGYVETRKVGSRCVFEFQVYDGATEDEIEEEAQTAMFEHIEWSFEVVEATATRGREE